MSQSSASSSANSFKPYPKDTTEPMQPTYKPKLVEEGLYSWWEENGFFKADNTKEGEKFVICLPPPNVTGSLHLGHTLTTAIQDCLARWHRMLGHNTLYLPGIDHAGIATQVVVEKKLMKERNQTRHDLGREGFLEETWAWVEQYGGKIKNQLRRTGASVDWSREVFTMDERLSRAVREAFIRMFNKGKIYRDNRLVNWCCVLKTAIADIEVDHREIAGSTKIEVPGHGGRKYEFGVITSFAYKVEGSDEEIVIATTRPETMLGDTAVAVHPDDPRYKHLHGKFVVHPFNGRRIPIITDSILVDMNLGTGAVKITPAHDPNDFECGKRHNLEFINILNDDGTINENGAPYTGMKRFDARVAVVADLEKHGLFREKNNHTYVIGFCSRSGDVIEPTIKPQWYVDVKDVAAKAAQAVRSGELKILPEAQKDKWFQWLDNIRDWNISRQLWWGHRIPAYLVTIEGRESETDPLKSEYFVAAHTHDEALEIAVERFKVDRSKITLKQDEDVLDTWFSSGLFPFSTMGWPDETADLAAFYPNSLLETGFDILFFWVARMVMMGIELTGQLPFKEVFLHSMVRDKFGKKMSKSLGNVIDPIDVIEGITLENLHAQLTAGNLDPKEHKRALQLQKEQFAGGIEECGCDALRFALLSYTGQGRNINLDIQRVVGYRKFCNKLWNATAFALTNLAGFTSLDTLPGLDSSELSFADKWILSRLNAAITSVNDNLKAYDFGEATTAIFNFFLYELCDVYLELTKPVMNADQSIEANKKAKQAAQHVLYTCIEFGLRLLHPMMPFVSEELWQRLPRSTALPADKCSIMVQDYPLPIAAWSNSKVEEGMAFVQDIIHKIRSCKAAYGLTNAKKPEVYVRCRTQELFDLITIEKRDIQTLAVTGDVHVLNGDEAAPAGCGTEVISEQCEVNIMLRGFVDFSAEIAKLEKKKVPLNKFIDNLLAKMNAPGYMEKVPENVRQQNQEKLDAQRHEMTVIDQAIANLRQLA